MKELPQICQEICFISREIEEKVLEFASVHGSTQGNYAIAVRIEGQVLLLSTKKEMAEGEENIADIVSLEVASTRALGSLLRTSPREGAAKICFDYEGKGVCIGFGYHGANPEIDQKIAEDSLRTFFNEKGFR